MFNTIRFIVRVLMPNFVKKIVAPWKQQKPSVLSVAQREFISLNNRNWKHSNRNISGDNGFVLVEGFLAYGPNYLLRTGIIAKAIEKELHLTPLVLFDGYIESEDGKISLYKSFDIEYFESTRNYQPSFYKKIHNAILSLKLYRKADKPEDLLSLEYMGIVFGDLLYDTMLKNTPGMYTLARISTKTLLYIYEALQLITMYRGIIDKNVIKFYISTHPQYLTYGLLIRVCLSKNIPVFETTDIQLWLHQNKSNRESISYPKFHDYLHQQIKPLMNKNSDSISTIEIDIILNNRFSGNFDQTDVRMAYKNKKIYSSSELRDALNIDNNYPFVFIFAHIFSDSPQSASNGMLYRDYYTWIEDTIRTACTISGINWIVKPHPSNAVYNETGLIDEIVDKYKSACLFMCPKDLSPASVIYVASAIVTAQGTVGIEYSCMGIPVVLAGKPFYSGFGFTIEPKSIKEYKTVLRDIKNLQKLSEKQKTIAKKVYAAFMEMQQTDTSLIDTDVLLKAWGGEGEPAAPDRAFELINQKLPGFDLKQYSLYKVAAELVKRIAVDKGEKRNQNV
ncbi:MAG: hypothetical protein P1P69_07885 [Methanosarcinaceae archaeon]|nr:hypothetical protein [Methanosarcinaceae archaeon]